MIDIVICVHNALFYLKKCLKSLSENSNSDFNLIIIDDASDILVEEYLKLYCSDKNANLIRNETKLGYTKSINVALNYVSSEFIILLNSDTVVTPNWIEKMLFLFKNEEKLAMVGPLSNAASFQSFPVVYDKDHKYAVNSIPLGFTIETFSAFLESNSLRKYPEVLFLNGFCMMIRSSIFDTVGTFDEKSFPNGYGEEIDYCLRVKFCGYTIRVADDTFIFHYKSKSYGDTMRNLLAKKSRIVLNAKYGKYQIDSAYKSMRDNVDLESIRFNFNALLNVN